MRKTVITHGYEVYFEDTLDTIEPFVQSLGEAWNIAKRHIHCTWSEGKVITIARCKEEAYLEQDGTPYEVHELYSYRPIKRFIREV